MMVGYAYLLVRPLPPKEPPEREPPPPKEPPLLERELPLLPLL